MTRTVATIAIMTIGAVATAHAELKIVSRTRVRPATASVPAEQNPMLSMFGEMTLQMAGPDGGANLTALIGDKAARIEYAQAAMGLDAGTVMLIQPNGDFTALTPKNQTYWTTTAQDASNMWKQLDAQPKLTQRRTGEFATIASLRAERVSFEWSIEFPGEAPMKMSGDIWVAVGRYQKYAPLAVRTNPVLASLGMTTLLERGIVLRSILRSPTFGAKDIETIVTAIGEGPVPAGTFTIPAGYTQIAVPDR